VTAAVRPTVIVVSTGRRPCIFTRVTQTLGSVEKSATVGVVTVPVPGLRERKKRRTAARIAEVAAHLFAQRGYEAVAVVDVAAAADVSEQTVYNYFPTKEDLVFDRSDEIRDALVEAVATRPPGMAAAVALAAVAHTLLNRTASIALDQSRGGMPSLSVGSAPLRRAGLDRSREQARALALVLEREGEPAGEAAIVAWALAGVFQLLIEELGQAQRDREDPMESAARLGRLVDSRVARLQRLDSP
jgi:AcrR family transcriptional regulator